MRILGEKSLTTRPVAAKHMTCFILVVKLLPKVLTIARIVAKAASESSWDLHRPYPMPYVLRNQENIWDGAFLYWHLGIKRDDSKILVFPVQRGRWRRFHSDINHRLDSLPHEEQNWLQNPWAYLLVLNFNLSFWKRRNIPELRRTAPLHLSSSTGTFAGILIIATATRLAIGTILVH